MVKIGLALLPLLQLVRLIHSIILSSKELKVLDAIDDFFDLGTLRLPWKLTKACNLVNLISSRWEACGQEVPILSGEINSDSHEELQC